MEVISLIPLPLERLCPKFVHGSAGRLSVSKGKRRSAKQSLMDEGRDERILPKLIGFDPFNKI